MDCAINTVAGEEVTWDLVIQCGRMHDGVVQYV